jgi:hypothetical protein
MILVLLFDSKFLSALAAAVQELRGTSLESQRPSPPPALLRGFD